MVERNIICYSEKSQSETETGESKFISMNDILSNDVLLRILVRLPNDCCRFVIRCSTVCKLWFSLINSIDYCNLRLMHDQSQSQSLPYALIFRYEYCGFSQPLYEYSSSSSAPNGSSTCYLDFLPWPKVRIYSSFDDLLLLSHGHDNNFLICNPLKRQYLDLPKPPASMARVRTDCIQGGLVFKPDVRQQRRLNPKLDLSQFSFRVMLRRWTGLDKDWISSYYVVTFCSETGKWRESALKFCDHSELHDSTPLSCNGMLHWLANTTMEECTYHGIVAVNPFEDANNPKYCRFIDFPLGLVQGNGRSSNLRVRFGLVRGQLRLAQLLGNKRVGFVLKVWELNYDHNVDDDDKGGSPWTWTLMHEVEVSANNHTLFVIAFHPDNGNVVFFLRYPRLICKYDIGEEKMEQVGHLPNEHYPYEFAESLYSYSLVHPLWPTPIPRAIPFV
ncbi:hypothetical protein TorRG33x02_061100 [Trema orientale]|uniref:F-box protein At3g26010-like beta-propeller domain-containing protein n=1 Tax=Trema orientale TaxID=63057 RepID=A0A2P5FJV6_TREOI|nr:hypothetical protein TorRG33x02_061100 [Trema orientale]